MTAIREGSIVRIRVSVGTKTGRPGVVLRVHPGSGVVLVAWGTGTLRAHLPRVLVGPRDAGGLALGLTKPTYFYGHNYWIGAAENVDVQRGSCPASLLAALRSVVRVG
jgi:hypothetical protein